MKEVKLETGIVLVHKNIDGVIRVSLKKKKWDGYIKVFIY